MVRTLVVMICLLAGVAATPALADEPSRIFVASTGNDSNDGSRASPKRSFQAAHDAVGAGGSIIVLDTAGYGAVKITKSVFVDASPGVSGFVPVPKVTAGIAVEIDAPNAEVSLRGLVIDGDGHNLGIVATNIRRLVVEDTLIRAVGTGIYLSAMSNATLHVHGGAVRGANEGIVIAAAAPNVAVSGIVSDVKIVGTSSDGVRGTARDVSSAVKVTLEHCTITDGFSYGLVADTGSEIVMDGLTITNNRVAYEAMSGYKVGAIYSRGNNTVYDNRETGSVIVKPLPAQ